MTRGQSTRRGSHSAFTFDISRDLLSYVNVRDYGQHIIEKEVCKLMCVTKSE